MPSITAPAPSSTSSAASENWRENGFGLYVHWPFCQAKCPYCDFNSHVAHGVDQRRWADAYTAEIRRIGAETQGRVLGSIFFGGGTPSLMDPETVAAVLDAARGSWAWANDIEITLEANPTSVEAGRFRAYREAGVDRVSLGVQALNDADLRRLGRLHDVATAKSALETARSAFDRVSFDLIYARQDQTLEDWRTELTEALAMAEGHLSLYQLTIESGTAFGDRLQRGLLRGLPDEDLGADLYLLTQDLCDAAGLPAYEVSNHSRPGHKSRHNLIYWRSGDYAGIGPGAHGRLTLNGMRLCSEAPRDPASWLRQVETGSAGELPRERLDEAAQWQERLMMGLRLHEGIALAADAHRLDTQALDELVEAGFVEADAGRLRLTSSGRPLLNAVLRRLL
ncbi:radical SAM family heme chaperone HemW [Roseitranquillus sediminis]|uniref:radical SAM family heme chaperone HemW n=1 Tax=Roseitranquillus sediminis TaxID=2809051 RepID=UPI001D0BF82E|nr:radical SAM family heme chaperone HemW [Roseitranquillus sediminis]MBM9593799.1 coproporphyrinogen III oxidase [Roseitranquillus sediminis]